MGSIRVPRGVCREGGEWHIKPGGSGGLTSRDVHCQTCDSKCAMHVVSGVICKYCCGKNPEIILKKKRRKARSLPCHLFCEHVKMQLAFLLFFSTSFIPELKAKLSTSCKWTKLGFPELATEIGNCVSFSSSPPWLQHVPRALSQQTWCCWFCLPCTGRIFFEGKTPWIWGNPPEFGENTLDLGWAHNLRVFGGSWGGLGEFGRDFWGGFGRFGDFQRGRMDGAGFCSLVCVRFGFLWFGCTRTLPVTVVKVMLLLTWAGQSTLRPDL